MRIVLFQQTAEIFLNDALSEIYLCFVFIDKIVHIEISFYNSLKLLFPEFDRVV